MFSNTRKQGFGLVLALFVGMLGLSSPFQHFAAFPNEVRLFNGQVKQLNYAMPVQAQVSYDPSVVQVNGSHAATAAIDLRQPLSIYAKEAGVTEMSLKLFGKIPFKTVKLSVVPDLKVIPGGQTIGVKVKSAGIMVVGHHQVKRADSSKVSPGELADIKVGDLITRMNGKPLSEVAQVAELVKSAGAAKQSLKLEIKRGGSLLVRELHPAFDEEDQAWRLGLYIRDSAAGVGTLTFYAPDQGVYGALGHVITDMDTQAPIEVGDGEIIQSNVTSINKSQTGEPGEKRAHFVREGKVLGNVQRNTPFGIFGQMTEMPSHTLDSQPVPIAFAEEVKTGPAEILTVIGGQKVERFSIQIEHVAKQSAPATKGMIIKITDQKLLSSTGGIVQGMSGSPILQDGKLIGAVTHVFVNDPSSGYGCFIEWMLQDAGVLLKPALNNHKAG